MPFACHPSRSQGPNVPPRALVSSPFGSTLGPGSYATNVIEGIKVGTLIRGYFSSVPKCWDSLAEQLSCTRLPGVARLSEVLWW